MLNKIIVELLEWATLLSNYSSKRIVMSTYCYDYSAFIQCLMFTTSTRIFKVLLIYTKPMKLLYLVSYMEIIYDIFQNTHLYIMFFESGHLVRHSVLMHPQTLFQNTCLLWINLYF